jgi:Arc/MetJ family transcription regulator
MQSGTRTTENNRSSIVPPATKSAYSFGGETPALLRLDLLEFVCAPIASGRGLIQTHARLEQTIFDGASNRVGRVSEQPPYRRPRLWEAVSRDVPFRGAVYDRHEVMVVQFCITDEVRWTSAERFSLAGRRLEVRDAFQRLVGNALSEELAPQGTFLDGAGEPIGAIWKPDRWGSSPRADCLFADAAGTEAGWIATPRIHAKLQSALYTPLAPSRSRNKTWFRPERQERHFLSITRRITRDLRLMVLATSAAIHLGLLDKPPGPEDD